jgi:acetyl-CoA acetyltransferase family protein
MGPELGRELWFVGAKRTAFGAFAFGAFGGALKDFSAVDLAAIASQAALKQAGLTPGDVDEVIFGNVHQTAADSVYLARHIGLRLEIPIKAPALTLNRLCGSSFEAVICGAKDILLGEAEIVLVGGTEALSAAPRLAPGTHWKRSSDPQTNQGTDAYAAWADKMGRKKFGEMIWDAYTDTHIGITQANTAENLAKQYQISRAETDAYAFRSQQAWARAKEAGRFLEEIVPVARNGHEPFVTDESPRPQTTLEFLAKLPATFQQGGAVTTGNSAVLADGAAALILCSKEAGERLGLKPLARLLNWGVIGCDPNIMGIGAGPAIRLLLERSRTTLADYDLIEVNEAFGVAYLAVERELGLVRDQTNVDGGAIAIGHPYAATGARIIGHLIYELRRRGARRGIGSTCIGGGQGAAVSIEVGS